MFAECQTLGKESARQRVVSGRPKADGRQSLPRAEDRVPNTGHSEKKALPSVFYKHSANNIFVFLHFGHQTFCGMFLHYVDLHVPFWDNYNSVCNS
jgi:hypothetical protein